jgi:hypothetical protein
MLFAVRKSEAANVSVGSIASFPPSRRVGFAPGADIRPTPAFSDDGGFRTAHRLRCLA